MSILSKRIRQLRKTKNIQQNEFAKKIGILNVVLSRYESGERRPDQGTLENINDYFSVTTDYLLGRSETPNMSEQDEFHAFANNKELERWYKELPSSDKEDLEALKQMWKIIKKNKKQLEISLRDF